MLQEVCVQSLKCAYRFFRPSYGVSWRGDQEPKEVVKPPEWEYFLGLSYFIQGFLGGGANHPTATTALMHIALAGTRCGLGCQYCVDGTEIPCLRVINE